VRRNREGHIFCAHCLIFAPTGFRTASGATAFGRLAACLTPPRVASLAGEGCSAIALAAAEKTTESLPGKVLDP
jgi:hypothetical protein